jgi:ABC-2 type transport system permease protein
MRHDRALVAAILVQPIMQLVIMGAGLSNKPQYVPWAVLDRSGTSASRRFVQDVQATGYFLSPRRVPSYAAGRRLLGDGKALGLLVLPRDFAREAARGRARVQLLLDGSDPLSSARIGGYVALVAAQFEAGVRTPRGRATADPRDGPAPIEVRQRFWFNPTLSDTRFYMAALAGMALTNLCLSVTALGLVSEREAGTYEHMLALPTRPLEIVLGKLAPYVAISYFVLGFTTVLAGLTFGVWPRGSVVALLLVTLPFVLASLAIGVLVSALSHTSAQAVFVAVFFIMPSFVLSGVMFPYALMPHPVREIGGLFPLRWYQIAARGIVERGAGLADVLPSFVALGAIFAVLLALIRWRLRPRLG